MGINQSRWDGQKCTVHQVYHQHLLITKESVECTLTAFQQDSSNEV